MNISFKEIANIIKNLTKNDFQKAYFGEVLIILDMYDENKKKNVIKNLSSKLSKNTDESISSLSEILFKIITVNNNSLVNLSYTPIPSTGYDGVFLCYEKNSIRFAEVKSSNLKYNTSPLNIWNKKIEEAEKDLIKKWKNYQSNSREKDHEIVASNLNIYLSKEIFHKFTKKQQENIKNTLRNHINNIEIAPLLLSTMSRNSNLKPKIKDDSKYIALIIEDLDKVLYIKQILVEKLKEIYEWSF